MKTITVNKVAFNKLVDCFTERSGNKFFLVQPLGKGYVQAFRLERGLQAKFWDFRFNNTLLLDGYTNCQTENIFFTLAFFLNLDGLTFDYGDLLLKQNTIWDTILISTTNSFKMEIAPEARGYCLSISFSKRWLSHNFFNNIGLDVLTEKITLTDASLLLQSMTSTDKKFIEELFDVSWKRTLGSFYIKSAVLKIIWDFFLKLNKEQYSTNNPCISAAVTQVKKYLCNHLTGHLPNLKDLARTFSLSESTLKRHFKRIYGVNMSTYFNRRKIEYAHHLIYEKKVNISEVAYMLGYSNINNFMSIYKRYIKSSNGQQTSSV
jgi:AraC-like DNA-binding protein